MNKKSKEFRSKYFYSPRRTTLPYNPNEVLEEKFKKIHEKRKVNKEEIIEK